jgi:hypothetical protein
LGQLRIGTKILSEGTFAFRRLEQVEGSEMRKVLTIEENQGGFDPSIRQKELTTELGQGLPIFCHVLSPL